jgi:hypothetical protein
MSAPRPPREGSCLPLIEDAVWLLKSAPAPVWAAYLAGMAPFSLALLAFATLMWESTLAPRQLAGGALGVTLAWIWMKHRQTRFVRDLLRLLHPELPRALPDKTRRVLRRQLILHPPGLFVLPLARMVTVLHPFLFGFFQHLTVREALGTPGGLSVPEQAWRDSTRELRQLSLLTLSAFTGLYLLMLVNWALLLALLPHLLFSLTGWENPFVQSAGNYLHISFLLSVFLLTGLCLDPLVKAVFLLRSHRMDAVSTGMDLRGRIRRLRVPGGGLALLLLLLCALPAALPAAWSPEAFEETVREVASERRFLWRAPPEALDRAPRESGRLTQALADAVVAVSRWIRAAANWLADRWEQWFPRRERPPDHTPSLLEGLQRAAELLMWILAVLLAATVLVLLVRFWLRHRAGRKNRSAAGPAAVPLPDLADHGVMADEMSAEAWLDLVRELLGRGEQRLALRALFLAYLARLADRDLLVIARHKSNREYEIELARRAHAAPGALPCYRDLRRSLESVWFGDRPAEAARVEELMETIRLLEASP